MEEKNNPGQQSYQEPALVGSSDSLDDSSLVSSFASLPQSNYQVDNMLEVHDQSSHASPVNTATARKAVGSFSKRKALIVSVSITVVVMLFTGASALFLGKNAPKQTNNSISSTVPVQDIGLENENTAELPPELQGTTESLLVTGDVITRGDLKFSNNSFVSVLRSTQLTASQTLTVPNTSGTLCVDSNNCNYANLGQLGQLDARLAQLGQQLNNFTVTANSGVTSINNQTGTVSVQGSTNQINVSTAGGTITFSTPQNLDANANVQFGNLTLGTGGSVRANNLQQTVAGNNVSINAGTDSIVFTAGGRTFTFPASGPASQTICTDGVSCASGGGQAVILSPTSVQNDTSTDASIFLNDTGGGNLIQVQSLGINRLVVDNVGNTSVAGSLTVASLGNGFVRSTAGLLSVVSAIDLSTSDVTNTLPVNRGGTGSASLGANGVLVGNGTSPVSSVTAGGNGLCLVSTAGAPTFTTCPGVSSLNSLSGSITLQGTTNQVAVTTGAGVITLSTPQDINTTSSPTFASLTLSGLTSGVVRVSAGTLTTGVVSLSSEVSGTLPVGNGGTGLTGTPTNGQLLIGNGTNYTLAALTQGAGIAITNGAGSITIASAFGASIDLGSETTGDYVGGVSGSGGVSVTGSGGANSTPAIALILQANKGLEVDGSGLSLIDCAPNQILKYNVSNQWVCAADVDTTGSFNVAGDSGTPENVANGDTLTIQGGDNIATTVGATDTITIATVNNPTFTTSVTTPLLQSSGALSITPNGAMTVGATGQTALLQGSTTTITSNGVGNDIVLTSADQIRLSGFNCSILGNGGKLTTDASGNLSCAADNSADPNAITGTGSANRLALFSGAQAIADSWLLQNGSTLELDNTRNLSLTGGNFSVTGTGLFTGLITANGGITVETGDTFTFNGEGFTDLTGTGLQFSSGSLQTTLGTSVDLTTEVTGILPVTNGGTGVNGSTAANGTLLIGNGSGYTLATLTAGSGITVNNGAGSIEIVNFFGTSIESGEITDLTITGADIANDTIALGTKTTGNYVATIGGNSQVSVSGSGSETAAVTLSLVADSIGDAQLAFDTGQNLTATSSPTFNGLTLSGNLTVEGGNTTVGTTTQAGTLTLSDGSNNTGALQTAGLGQNTTFTLPDPGAASATICLSTGNCAGAGGGVTTAGGTANRIALFNGAQTIADSWLLQNGSTMQLDNTRNLELIGGNLTLTSGNLNITGNQTTSGTVTFSALANGFLEANGSGLVSVGTIDLGGDTAGNYVATITAGNGISGSSNTEGGTPTIALGNLTADWVQSGAFDVVYDNAGAELRILESVGGAFYGTFDVGDLSGNETYTFLQGGTIVSSGNVASFATTAVTAGNGLTGGGTTGALTLDIGAGNGITVNANDIAVVYGSAANTAVQGNTGITVTAGTNLTGGGSITLGAGGTVTLDVSNSPTFSGTVTVQGSTVSIGTASTTTGSLDLYNAGSTFAGSVRVASLGQATLYTLPDPGAASATICLSTGNCASAGGGVTTAGGTANQLAKFTGAQVIADSTISDDGTNVTTSVDLIVQGGSATIGTALQDGALTLYGNGFTASISAALTGNQSYTLPDGTGEFCIKELANCSGAAGGNAPNSSQYLTLALDAGLTAERTLSFNGTNFSVVDNGANNSYTVNTAQNINTAATPSFAGLTLTGNLNMNANTIQGTTAVIDFTNFDVASTGVVTAGTYNGQTISNAASFTGSLTVAGLTTLNGGLTIETGDTLTFNGDAFTDLTGNGLQVSTNVLTLMVQANKGLEVDVNGLSLIDCLSGEVLKYNGSNQWACATDAGAGGVGDDVLVNGVNAVGANFINTAANGTTAAITWGLNNVTDPDEISLTVGVASATEAGIITTGAQTFAGLKTFNNGITLASNQTINLTGGTTASRPGSPTEGMLYFDTDTDKLLVYSNGKWQADRSTATKIVAASNSSQAAKDSADYVADGTGDQVEINAALTAATGGKVYLMEGTYVASATILVPNNTTLAGSGRGTIVELADLDATDNLVENSDTTTGTGVTIQDIRFDGRNDLNTAGTQEGITLANMGGGGGSSARQGARLTNLWVSRFRNTGLSLTNSNNNTISNNSLSNNSIGMTVTSSSHNSITGNISQGNSSYGFYFGNSPYNSMTSNISQGNSSHGIALDGNSNSNVVNSNKIHDNGSGGSSSGIIIISSDSNTLTGNDITDTAGSGYAINISNAASDTNYLADNRYSGTGAANIQDLGTGTIYGGQLDGSGNFAINPSGNIELQSNTNVTGTLSVSGLITANGGLTVEAGDTFTVNGDGFTDLTGNGLAVVSNALTVSVQANKGLEVDANGLSLIDCVTDDYVLKYDTGTNTWGCAADAGASGTGDDVSVNGVAADNANFIDTTASGTVAGITFNLNNVPAPDEISLTVSNASATEAGAVTTGAQTFAGAKTFNGQIIAGAGINLGSQTLQGTTSVIDFTNFDVDASGNTTVGGTLGVTGAATLTSTLSVQGATITLGGAAQQGTFVINDGSGQTGSLSVANLAANRTFTLPEYTTGTGTICLDSGNCAGSGSGVTTAGGTTDRLAKFTGSQAIGDSSISDNGTIVSILGSTDLSVLGGDITLGTTSGAGSIVLHDGNGQTTTISAGNSAGNLAFVLPTTVGSNGQCVKNSATPGVLTFANCNNGSGAGGAITLQDAYDAGNTIATTDNRNLLFTFSDTATDSSFLINLQCATCSANGGRFAVQDNGTDLLTVNPDGTIVLAGTQIQVTAAGNLTTSGTGSFQGASVSVGATALQGTLILNDGSTNTGTIRTAALGSNRTYVFPDEGTNAVVCLNTGNCAGAGSGLTGSGTAGQVAYFDATQNLISSANLLFDGTNMDVAGTLNVGTANAFSVAANGNITTGGDLAVNGGDITSSAGTLNINTTGTGNTTIGNGSGITTLNGIGVAFNTSLLSRLAAGTLTFNLNDAANTTLALTNTGTGVANLTVDGSGTFAANLTVDTSTLIVDSTTDRVGVGDTTPDYKFEIQGTSGTGYIAATNSTDGDIFAIDSSGNLSLGGNTRINASGAFFATTGSAGNPSYNFSGETGSNTGMFLIGNDQLGFSTGGTQRLSIDASGNSVFSGTLAVQGASATVGAAALQGSFILNDGDGETVSITIDDVAANSVIKIPDAVSASDTFCLLTLNNCVGAATTLQGAYNADVDGSDAIIALTAADDSLIIRNPAASGTDSGFVLTIDQLATSAVGGLSISSAGVGAPLLRVTDTTATARDVFTIADSGLATFRAQTDSTVAFQSMNAAGTAIFKVDTTSDGAVNIETAGANGTGRLNVNGVIYGQGTAGTGDVLHVGNDGKLVDVNLTNTVGLYGLTDTTVGSLKLGSGGGTISGASGNIGIGDATPVALFTVGASDAFRVNNSGDVLTAGVATFSGASVTIGAAALQGSLVLNDGNGGQTATIQSGNIAANTVISIPAAVGATDTFCLVTLNNCAGAPSTLQAAYNADADGSDAIIAMTSTDGSLIFRNPSSGGSASAYVVNIEQLATGAVGGLVVTNAGTGNSLRVNDDGTDTDNTPLVVDDSGNLLVGVASAPSTMGKILSVVSNASTTQFQNPSGALALINTDQTANNYVELYFGDEVGNASAGISARLTDHTNNYGDLLFNTKSASGLSTKLTVLSAGNVGIGEVAPDAKLEVLSTSSSTSAGTLKGVELTVTDTGIVTTGTDTTYGQRIAVTRTGATGGTINSFGLDIQATSDNAGAGTSTLTGLNINVSGADTNYAATFQGGNVGIGTGTPATNRALHVVGGDNVIRVESVSGQAFIEFRNSGSGSNGAAVSSTGDNFQIWTAGNARLTVSAAGDSTFSGNVSSSGTITADSSGTFGAAHATLGVQMGGGTNGSEIKLRNSGTSHFSIANTANTFTIGVANGNAGIGAAITPFLTMDGSTGAATLASTLAVQGASVTVGAAALQGSLILNDGDGETVSITIDDVAANSVVRIPNTVSASDTFCLLTLGNCFGSGSGGTLQAAYDADVDGSNAVIALTSADGGVIIRDNATPLGSTLFAVQNSAGTSSYLNVNATGVTIAGTISIPGTGTGSERFGASAAVNGNESLAVGNSANVQGWTSVAVGYGATTAVSAQGSTVVGHNSSTTAQNGTAIGSGAVAGNTATALGAGAGATTNEAVALGASSTAGFINSIALGYGATTTGTDQLVIGGGTNGIGNVFIGKGVTHATPGGFTLQATGGSGTDIAGGSVSIAGGRGTGTGIGGSITFQYAPAGSTGASLNALQTACIISGTNGSLSCPGAGAGSQRFGSNATAAGNDSLAVGEGAAAGGLRGVAIGRNTSSGQDAVTLGHGATAGTSSTAIGAGATSTAGDYSIAIGAGATTTGNNGIAIGINSSAAASQLVVNGVTSGYFGNGATNATPNNFTLQGTGSSVAGTTGASFTLSGGAGATTTTGSAGGALTLMGGNAGGTAGGAGGVITLQAGNASGTNIVGANTVVAGGRGTGIAGGGSILLQTAPSNGGNNDILGTLTTRLEVQADGDIAMNTDTLFVDATNGRVGIGTNTPDYFFDIEKTQDGPVLARVYNNRNGGNDISGLYLGTWGAPTQFQLTANNSTGGGVSGTLGGASSVNFNNTANGNMAFLTNNTMRTIIGTNNVTTFGNGITDIAPAAYRIQGTGSATAGTVGGVFTVAGGAGATATTGSAGGGLNLQGGNAGGSGNNNGGSVAIDGGTSTGTTGLRGSVDIQAAGGNVNIGGNANGALNSWTTNGNALPATRADAGIVSHNGYVYVFGGSAGGVFDSPITTVHYAKVNADGSIGTWATTSAMAGARQEFGFTVANGYVYALGGNSASYLSPSLTNTVQFARIKADGTLDTWQTTTNLPGTRRLTSAASANGYVYVVGGTGGQTAVYYGKVNVDGTISSWTTSANSLPAGREAAGVAAVNGYLYVVGGADSGATAQTSVYYSKLDPTNGSNAAFSTETDTLPAARADAELVVMNGSLYVLGGQAGSAVNTTYYAAINNNGSINAWTTNTAPITAGRYGHMSVAVNGYAYVMGGINGGAGQSTVYYASIQRVRMAGAIDLLGISGENLAEGGIASSLTAGNTLISGSLQVTDTASIAGGVTIGRELNVGGSAYVRSASATDVGMTVQGASGQTADLMQLKDGTGAVVAKFLADGTALFGNAASCGTASTLICIDESRIELKNVGGNNSTQIIQNSNGPLEFSNGPNSGQPFAGVLVKGDKTTAFQIQNGSSQSILTADTVNSQLLTSNISPLTAASITSNKLTTVDSTGDVGWHTNVRTAPDGFQRIVYYDVTNTNLKYVRCQNYDCSVSTISTIDVNAGTDTGLYASMELGTDGFARIAYYDATPANLDLKYAVCNDDNCSSPTITTVDTANDVGKSASLVLDANNLARISFQDATNQDLRYVECTNAACSTNNKVSLDTAIASGFYNKMVIGKDGLARIAYMDSTNGDLKYLRCTNTACTTTTTAVVLDDQGASNVGYVGAIILDRNGNAIVAAYDFVAKDLRYTVCANVDCTTKTTTTLDSTNDVGSYASMVLGQDGFPRIAYYEAAPDRNLKYITCTSLACTSPTPVYLDGTGVAPNDQSGSDTSMTIGADGYVRVSYYDFTGGNLRMIQPNFADGLTIGAASNRFARLFVANAEVSNVLRIGDTTNGINFSASNGFRLSGSARNSNTATLKPEFEGAIFRGDGAGNTGTLTSDFCSGSSAMNINNTVCNTTETHTYYQWTHNETTAQDYDIIVRYRVPDNFDSAEAFSNHVAIRGFASKSAASATNSVTMALYNDSGAQCGSTTNITNGTANQWGAGVVLGSISGDGDCENIDAGEYVTFVLHMTANSTGTTGEIIRMGEIEISYKSTY